MSVIRVNKTRDYTVMANEHLRDKRLSLKAKGLQSVMLSLPDNWDYSIRGLCAIVKENETAVKSALSELRENGYLQVTKLYPSQTKTGRIEWLYDVYELPLEKQGVENLPIESQQIENHAQLSTKERSTKKQSTKKQSTKEKNTDDSKRKRFVKPTLEEVTAYCKERNNNIDPQRFIDYYESNGWMVGRTRMKDWRAAIRNWGRRDGGKPKQDKFCHSDTKQPDWEPIPGIDY